MPVKTRHTQRRLSVRRSFRTRPSVQQPIVRVDPVEVKLFYEDSWDDDFASKSPVPRKPRKVKTLPEKIPYIFEEDENDEDCEAHVDNAENVPPVSDFDSDRSAIERMNAEFADAEEYSLFIENQDGVRLKPVGNKLVEYDKYDGPKSTAHVFPQKNITPRSPNLAQLEAERHQFRKAIWSYLRGCTPRRQRNSLRLSAFTGGSTRKEVVTNDLLRRTTHVPLAATEPIEETPETESTAVSSTHLRNQHQGENAPPNTTLVATPKGRVPSTGSRKPCTLLTTSFLDDDSVPVRSSSVHELSFSSFSEMQGPAQSSTPMQKCFPQAHSTPFEANGAEASGHVLVKSLSFQSPRWANVTGRSKERTMSRNSQHSFLADASNSPPNAHDSFEDAGACIIPEITPAPESDDIVQNDIVNGDKEEQNLAVLLERSMELSLSRSEQDVSGNTLATLAEDVPFQVTRHSPNQTRNVTQMTTNLTNRNISRLTNASFVEIPFYLAGFSDAERATPMEELLYVIGQSNVIEWTELPEDVFTCPRKLGEGVYGEVFSTTYKGQPIALKVIPFHGDKKVYNGKVNGEYLLDAAGILPEILINRELSALYDPSADFSTPNFIQLLKTNVVRGLYPESFLSAWDEYDEAKESENDRPTEYASKEQLFVTMGMALGGVDLEHFQMKNEDQVLSTLLQITISLIVAEEKLEFEHRDLHIGNVLILEEDNDLEYKFSGGTMILRSRGVKVNLIDFTLSRMRKEETTIYRDLESDEELFAGTGDYQFDIYRMMRHENQGDWLAFTPKTNCFWLHYLSKQLISKQKCKKAIPKKRRQVLQCMWDQLLNFDTLRDVFTSDDFYDVLQRHLIIKARPNE